MDEQFVDRLVELTNHERTKAGLPTLKLNPVLAAVAQKHSIDMALQDYFSHTNLDGSTPVERAKAEGYSSEYVGENIYASGTTPEDAFQGWMDSPVYQENILNPKYQEIGVGYYFLANDTGDVNYRHYWTQVFGKP